MVSFYPGPSRLDPQLERYMTDALHSGILSQNHRSETFMKLYEETWKSVCAYFHVPDDYSLYFVSSATECWEILSQEVGHLPTLHVYNGAFGEKGFLINQSFHPKTVKGVSFGTEELPLAVPLKTEVIHLTQNETSNGTQLPIAYLEELRKQNAEALITVDATSSLGGQVLPMAAADVWFASVQKCLGLPSGMGILICSPRFVARCKENQTTYYNSIRNQEAQFIKRQTTHTPNTLGIYLLHRVLSDRENLSSVHDRLKHQASAWYTTLSQHALFQPLIQAVELRSDTIIAAKGKSTAIQRFKNYCAENNYIVGNGYGNYKDDTFRIANFPSHQSEEIHFLKQLLLSSK